MAVPRTSWTHERLVALDLEGSGAQDRDNEAILEIAVVPLAAGRLDVPNAYSTLVNPSRKIRQGPWISPGLTNTNLAGAPSIAEVEPQLTQRLDAAVIVGHNIDVDWRLLHRRCPTIRPAALIDTLRLAKHLRPHDKGHGLTSLVDRLGLTADINHLATASQPHRALWDSIAAGRLLAELIASSYPDDPPLHELLDIAGIALNTEPPPRLF